MDVKKRAKNVKNYMLKWRLILKITWNTMKKIANKTIKKKLLDYIFFLILYYSVILKLKKNFVSLEKNSQGFFFKPNLNLIESFLFLWWFYIHLIISLWSVAISSISSLLHIFLFVFILLFATLLESYHLVRSSNPMKVLKSISPPFRLGSNMLPLNK